MYRFALSMLKNTSDAEDAVQDICVKFLAQSAKSFSTTTIRNQEAYLMQSLKNRCLDILKLSQSRQTEELDEKIEAMVSSDPFSFTRNRDISEIISSLMEKLPMQQQMCLRLRDIEGYELEEIAEILEISYSNVRTSLFRAREFLRRNLSKIDI